MRSEAAFENSTGSDKVSAYHAAAHDAWHGDKADGPLRLMVTSGSMRPVLRENDIVVAQPVDPHALQPGEVIVVQREGEWITHRLVTIDGHGWHTQGDAARHADDPAGEKEIVGRVIAIERGDQTIDLRQPRRRVIDRRINRVQRLRLRLFAGLRKAGAARSGGITHALATLIDWPFQFAVRVLLRL